MPKFVCGWAAAGGTAVGTSMPYSRTRVGKWVKFAAMAVALFMCACKPDLTCGKGRPLAIEIAKSNIPVAVYFAGIDVDIDVIDVITRNETKFLAECAATVIIKGRGKDVAQGKVGDVAITYKVERLDDGRLSVTVFGIRF